MSQLKLRYFFSLTLLHSERPKLYGVLAILSAIGLACYQKVRINPCITRLLECHDF